LELEQTSSAFISGGSTIYESVSPAEGNYSFRDWNFGKSSSDIDGGLAS